MFFYFGCTKKQSTQQNISINEVLERACNDSMRESLKKEIEWQQENLSEDQMNQSLRNMRDNIRC